MTEIIGHWIMPSGAQHWRIGRRRTPVADTIRLPDHIGARIADGRDIMAELDHYIDEERSRPRRLTGCCAVHEDGWDRRGRGPG